MSERTTLLATILENPADNTARLVLADVLRESADPDEQAQGRFLWAGVTASQSQNQRVSEDPLHRAALLEITAVASAAFPALWVANLGFGSGRLRRGDWACEHEADWRDRVAVRVGSVVATFRRGMLTELTLTSGEWVAVGLNAFTRWPLERVTITDVPDLKFRIYPPGEAQRNWVLVAALPGGVSMASFPDRLALLSGLNAGCAEQVERFRSGENQ